jgi:hypothetical protein
MREHCENQQKYGYKISLLIAKYQQIHQSTNPSINKSTNQQNEQSHLPSTHRT